MNETMFKNDLSEEEIAEYRQWARDNYKPFSNIDSLWHPYVQEECAKMNVEILEGKQQ